MTNLNAAFAEQEAARQRAIESAESTVHPPSGVHGWNWTLKNEEGTWSISPETVLAMRERGLAANLTEEQVEYARKQHASGDDARRALRTGRLS